MAMTEVASNANRKLKLILEKIVEEYDLGNGGDIKLGSHHFLQDTGIDDNQFLAILKKLEQNHVLESFHVHANARTDDGDLVCFLKPLNHFKSRAEDYIERLSENEPVKTISGSILYLDRGDLWHGDKKHFCYEMTGMKDHLEIVKYMIDNEDYQKTKDIALALGIPEQDVRTKIHKIRAKIKNRLDIPDLIENKRGLGYRINPKYQIKVIK